MKEKWRACRIHIMAVLCVLFAGLALEFACNYRELSLSEAERERKEIAVSLEDISGFEETGQGLLFGQEYGVITLDLGGQYVGRFGYTYDYDGLLNTDIDIDAYNIYGEVRERDQIHIADRNSKLVQESWVSVGKYVDKIHLRVDQSVLEEPGLSYIDFKEYPLTITGFFVDNQPVIHWYRLLFFWCCLGLAAFLWINRKSLENHVEKGFLIIAMSAGILMILCLPVSKVSWDEEIHFQNAFWLSSYPLASDVSDGIMQQFSARIDTWPYNQPSGQEEQQLLNEYWNINGDYRTGNHHWSAVTDKTTFQGYAGSMIMLRLGRLLHLPFPLLFRLGRLGNLMAYCVIMYFAIKKTPLGKGIMAFIGLMPTPVFLASVYAYDPMVTACLYLAFAWILEKTLDDGKKMNWKSYAAIVAVFFIGCRTKAVYAPLGLLALMIPKERYESKKQQRLMQGGIVLMVLVLMASFLLPVLISPSETGDLRGGATSEVGQMAYVLGQPLAYTVLLFQNIWKALPEYLMGKEIFGTLGHLGVTDFEWMFYVTAVFLILTDTRKTVKTGLNGKQKLFMTLLMGAAAVLIWTAMYMAFTVPGETFIQGVQARYMLPFLFLAYMVLHSERVTVRIPQRFYDTGVLAVSGGILLLTIYQLLLVPYCF